MKLLFIVVGLLVSANCYAQREIGLESINTTKAKEIVAFLSSDQIEGREAGERGARIIADYLASHFYALGLEGIKATEGGESPLNCYYQPFDTAKVSSFFADTMQFMHLNNIIGKIEGKNPNEVVIIGAHYDHLGIQNGEIYNGADDNASGVSAVLQIANAFINSGVKPERTVIFALWDGEEKGLLGSDYYVRSHSNISSVKGYLNFDMIGRNSDEANPQTLTLFYTAANSAFEQWSREDIIEYSLEIKPQYNAWDRPVGGSDNSSFAEKDIPIIWYHTQGHPDYHKPTYTVEKINWDKLLNITKSAYLNMWNLANVKTY